MSAPAKDEPRACRELGPDATLERALNFAARWRALGGEAIELYDFCANVRNERVNLPRMPSWAEEIGAMFGPQSGRVLIWVAPLLGAGGPFQLVLHRPIAWKRGPALVSYAGIADTRDSVASGGTGQHSSVPRQRLTGTEQRFAGLERASGEPLVLSLPTRGESLILIAESAKY